MSLQDVFQAPYDYDDDIKIVPHSDGWQYGIYNQVYGWMFREKVFSTPEINELLQRRGYHLVNKRNEQVLFEPRWDYRKNQPTWGTFCDWLYVYYAYKHDWADHEAGTLQSKLYMREELIQATAQRDAYLDIMERIHDVKLDCSSSYQWGLEQEQKYLQGVEPTEETILTREWRDGEKKRKHTYTVYVHFVHTLYEYMEFLERVVMNPGE